MLRSHQREVLDIARAIRAGSKTRAIIAHVTPGGGKSLLPVVLAAELLANGYADRICWIVPRRSLQKQAEEAFSDLGFREMLSHRHSIRIATNEIDPSRGLAGYVTTYAALAVDDNAVNAAEFDKRRYILVLDEPHHIAVDSAYERAIAPLVAKAKLVLYMSGTLDRDDDLRIAFMPYVPAGMPDLPPAQILNLTPTPETAVVTYGRAQALIDRAIIRLKFEHLDSSAKWKEDGFERSMDSFNDGDGSESHKALWTALSTKFAYELLDKTIKSWRETKAINPRSKLLVVAARQVHAKKYQDYLTAKGIRAGLATMDEGSGAMDAIEGFKDCRNERRLDALVTVQMAYEGLDVPAITHIACLTNIRSRPWIEQMLARATRNDRAAGSWESQVATVYIPDDPIMRVVIDHITRNDSRVIPPDPVKGESNGAERVLSVLEPLDSQATEQRQSELISEDEKKALEHAMALAGIENVTPEQIRRVLALSGYIRHSDALKQNALTPSQQEDQIRADIHRWVIAYSQKSKRTPMDLNASVRRHFKKRRQEMTLPELQAAYKWVRAKFPLNSLFGA